MKREILILCLLWIAFVIPKAQGSYTLPPASQTQGYADNLISSYNALIDSSQSNFDTVRGYFSLYHAIGNTFEVVVLQTAANVSGYVTMIFIPIGGNSPVVIMDSNETFDQQFPISLPGENVTFENLRFNLSQTIVHVNLAYGISSTDITGDYMTNSKNAAESLYRQDVRRIPQPTITIPSHSIVADAYSCIFAGICGVIGFFIGIGSGLYVFLEKRHSRVPDRESRRRRKQPKV